MSEKRDIVVSASAAAYKLYKDKLNAIGKKLKVKKGDKRAVVLDTITFVAVMVKDNLLLWQQLYASILSVTYARGGTYFQNSVSVNTAISQINIDPAFYARMAERIAARYGSPYAEDAKIFIQHYLILTLGNGVALSFLNKNSSGVWISTLSTVIEMGVVRGNSSFYVMNRYTLIGGDFGLYAYSIPENILTYDVAGTSVVRPYPGLNVTATIPSTAISVTTSTGVAVAATFSGSIRYTGTGFVISIGLTIPALPVTTPEGAVTVAYTNTITSKATGSLVLDSSSTIVGLRATIESFQLKVLTPSEFLVVPAGTPITNQRRVESFSPSINSGILLIRRVEDYTVTETSSTVTFPEPPDPFVTYLKFITTTTRTCNDIINDTVAVRYYIDIDGGIQQESVIVSDSYTESFTADNISEFDSFAVGGGGYPFTNNETRTGSFSGTLKAYLNSSLVDIGSITHEYNVSNNTSGTSQTSFAGTYSQTGGNVITIDTLTSETSGEFVQVAGVTTASEITVEPYDSIAASYSVVDSGIGDYYAVSRALAVRVVGATTPVTYIQGVSILYDGLYGSGTVSGGGTVGTITVTGAYTFTVTTINPPTLFTNNINDWVSPYTPPDNSYTTNTSLLLPETHAQGVRTVVQTAYGVSGTASITGTIETTTSKVYSFRIPRIANISKEWPINIVQEPLMLIAAFMPRACIAVSNGTTVKVVIFTTLVQTFIANRGTTSFSAYTVADCDGASARVDAYLVQLLNAQTAKNTVTGVVTGDAGFAADAGTTLDALIAEGDTVKDMYVALRQLIIDNPATSPVEHVVSLIAGGYTFINGSDTTTLKLYINIGNGGPYYVG